MSCCFVILTHCQGRRGRRGWSEFWSAARQSQRTNRSSDTSGPSDKSFLFFFFFLCFPIQYIYINRHTNAQRRKYHTNHPPFSIQFGPSSYVAPPKTQLPGLPVPQSPCLSVWRLNDGRFHLKGNRNTLIPVEHTPYASGVDFYDAFGIYARPSRAQGPKSCM